MVDPPSTMDRVNLCIAYLPQPYISIKAFYSILEVVLQSTFKRTQMVSPLVLPCQTLKQSNPRRTSSRRSLVTTLLTRHVSRSAACWCHGVTRDPLRYV